MNTAASKLDEISADARLRELARSREKSQHDAATELAGAERRGEKRGAEWICFRISFHIGMNRLYTFLK